MTADAAFCSEFAIFAGRLADAARIETLPRFRAGSAVTSKAGASFDPVTDADREAERVVRGMIGAVYPTHGVIGEEFGAERPDADYRWVIDPVDGTRAFVCGVSTWATLIGLERAGKAELGLIDQPFTDERWIGAGGASVYRRGGAERRCRTSGVTALAQARLSTTDPRREAYFTADEAAAFADLAAKSQVARFSLDAYAYGLLAIGELDLVVEASLKHHDYCALVSVVEGAGGVITGWEGEPLGGCARGRVIAAATPELHRVALDVLNARR
jgi:myo-inositol-1(or 4)-monophosphatase